MWLSDRRLYPAFIFAFVLGVALLLPGWPPVRAEGWHMPAPEAPVGCEAVFAATTRGGAETPARSGWACNRPAGPREGVVVERVVDGDTIVLVGGERVRYIGIDAPEASGQREPYAEEATHANRRLVEGETVQLERDVSETDRYGRLLRYVYANGILVNAELVREGYAEAVEYPPDTRLSRCLEELEIEAREARRGMWGVR